MCRSWCGLVGVVALAAAVSADEFDVELGQKIREADLTAGAFDGETFVLGPLFPAPSFAARDGGCVGTLGDPTFESFRPFDMKGNVIRLFRGSTMQAGNLLNAPLVLMPGAEVVGDRLWLGENTDLFMSGGRLDIAQLRLRTDSRIEILGGVIEGEILDGFMGAEVRVVGGRLAGGAQLFPGSFFAGGEAARGSILHGGHLAGGRFKFTSVGGSSGSPVMISGGLHDDVTGHQPRDGFVMTGGRVTASLAWTLRATSPAGHLRFLGGLLGDDIEMAFFINSSSEAVTTLDILGGRMGNEGDFENTNPSAVLGTSHFVVNHRAGTLGDDWLFNSGSELNLSGGSIGEVLYVGRGGVINVSGGSFGPNLRVSGSSPLALPETELNLFVTEAAIDGVPLVLTPGVPELIGQRGVLDSQSLSCSSVMTGVLADGTPFDLDLCSSFLNPDLGDVDGIDSVGVRLTVTLADGPVFVGPGQTMTEADLLAGFFDGRAFALDDATVIKLDGDLAPLGTHESPFDLGWARVDVGPSGVVGSGGGGASAGLTRVLLNMEPGGSIGDGFNMTDAVLNMAGGSIGTGLSVTDLGVINMADGSIGDGMTVDDLGTVTVKNGAVGADTIVTGGTLNMDGGTLGNDTVVELNGTLNIDGAAVGDDLFANTTGTVNLFSGSIGIRFQVQRRNAVNVYGGTIGGGMRVFPESSLNMRGGTIENVNLIECGAEITGGTIGLAILNNGATVDLLDGTIGDQTNIRAGSMLNMHGGALGDSVDVSASTVNLHGGTVGIGYRAMDGSVTNLYVQNARVDGVPIPLEIGERVAITQRGGELLEATLLDGSLVDFRLNASHLPLRDSFEGSAVLTVARPFPESAGDGALDENDIRFFLAGLALGDPDRDLDGSGSADILDLARYLRLFDAFDPAADLY